MKKLLGVLTFYPVLTGPVRGPVDVGDACPGRKAEELHTAQF